VLISCFNDISAIGALEAVEEAGPEKLTAIVGQRVRKRAVESLLANRVL
jgi:ABC-type sugar transport system substrate-binding protein